MYTTDQNLTCADCKTEVTFTASEQEFFAQKGFSAPRRFKPCRNAAKAAKVLYDRPLRDYAYLFTEYQRERSEMLAQLAGLKQDIERLKAAAG